MSSYVKLCSDESFNFEILRNLSLARYEGADVTEVLRAAASLKPGDFEAYHDVWNSLAARIHEQANLIDAAKNPISARDAYFRAATYYRSADFYLHGNPSDPRINKLWDQMMTCFDKAIALLPSPGKRLTLKGDGFDIPAIYYRLVPDDATPRPTIIMGSGFDGAQEELMHIYGFAALQRGYNIITYEGPGQPLVRRQQGLGFTHEWEKAVSPVVDYVTTLPEVDAKRIVLVGVSMGGYFCVRAAAFEHRLAATIALDGVYDMFPAIKRVLPVNVIAAYYAGDSKEVDELIRGMLSNEKTPAVSRWMFENGMWSFASDSPFELLKKMELMTLDGVAARVKCPVMVCEASKDMFFEGQPSQVKEALGDLATLAVFTEEDGADIHCHFGALSFANQRVYDWLQDVLSKV